MKLHRSVVLPTLVLAFGSAIACGDDDTTGGGNSSGGIIVLPGAEGGVIPTKPNDAGADSGGDSGDGGSNGNSEAGSGPLITTTSLPAVLAGSAVSITFAANSLTPITWTVASGPLPPGLTLSSDGKLTGTPTVVGGFPFRISATSAEGTSSANFVLTVAAPAADAYLLLPGNKLSRFATTFPSGASAAVALTGVDAAETIVSIDRRPQNGWLYGLGFNNATKAIRLYAIEPDANLAVPLGPAASTFNPALAGPIFGMDFNPASDRLCVVTSGQKNFRINPNTGLPIDSDGDGTNGDTPDININSGTSNAATETAFTNNAPNTASTTEYTVAASKLYIQNTPESGKLTLPSSLTNVDTVFGFDIPKGVNAPSPNAAVTSGSGFALLKLTSDVALQFTSVDLTNGTTTALGKFAATDALGFTLAPNGTHAMIALSGDGLGLIRFDESTPGTSTPIDLGATLVAGETMVGIAYRPVTGALYGLAINPTADTGTLYLIDPQTGAVSRVGAASGMISLTVAAVAVDFPAASVGWGFDFSPSSDRIRVTTGGGLNFRINPDTGVPASANPDANITLSGASSGLEAVSYTNAPISTGVTTEYGINVANKALHIVNPPNNGILGAAIPITLGGTPLGFTAVGGFDIPLSVKAPTANAAVTEGSGYAVLTVGGTAGVYKINLVDGTATLLGSLVGGTRALVVGR